MMEQTVESRYQSIIQERKFKRGHIIKSLNRHLSDGLKLGIRTSNTSTVFQQDLLALQSGFQSTDNNYINCKITTTSTCCLKVISLPDDRPTDGLPVNSNNAYQNSKIYQRLLNRIKDYLTVLKTTFQSSITKSDKLNFSNVEYDNYSILLHEKD